MDISSLEVPRFAGVLMAVVIICLTLGLAGGRQLFKKVTQRYFINYPRISRRLCGCLFSGTLARLSKIGENKEMSNMNKVVRFAKNHGGKILAGASVGVAGVSTASAQITNAVITQMEGTFAQTQGLGEDASIVAGTLALISIAVSFIWRARG